MQSAAKQSHGTASAMHVNTTLDDIIPASDIPKKYPHLYSEKSWHWAVVQRKNNGLTRAFRKIGKQLFVNTKVLAECIDQQADS